MVRHFPILENSETELYVDPRNGRRNNTTRSSLGSCGSLASLARISEPKHLSDKEKQKIPPDQTHFVVVNWIDIKLQEV